MSVEIIHDMAKNLHVYFLWHASYASNTICLKNDWKCTWMSINCVESVSSEQFTVRVVLVQCRHDTPMTSIVFIEITVRWWWCLNSH